MNINWKSPLGILMAVATLGALVALLKLAWMGVQMGADAVSGDQKYGTKARALVGI